MVMLNKESNSKVIVKCRFCQVKFECNGVCFEDNYKDYVDHIKIFGIYRCICSNCVELYKLNIIDSFVLDSRIRKLLLCDLLSQDDKNILQQIYVLRKLNDFY